MIVRFALVVVLASVLGGASSAQASATHDVPPGMYTYAQAVQLGLVNPADFTPPPGMEICPPYDPAKAAIPPGAPPPPQNAPVCFSNPVDIARSIVVVLEPGPPMSAVASTSSNRCDPAPFPNHRLNGSCDPLTQYHGSSMLTESSDPSVCHFAGCPPQQHFYSRTSLTTPADNVIEVGWTESNWGDPGKTGDTQRVQTITWPAGERQNPMLHGTILPGNDYSFRAQHCGLPGELLVCMEMWNGSSWTLLREWTGVMRCLNATGTFNCYADFLSEAFSSNTSQWFDLNGGADGLRTQNIEVRRDWWDLLTTGVWMERDPYSICRVSDYHHFKAFRGSPSC